MPLSAPCETRASCKHKTEQARGRTLLANVGIYAVFLTWTQLILPWGLLLALAALLMPAPWRAHVRLQRAVRRLVTFYGRGTLFFLRPWLPVRVGHARRALEAGPCIITANHQSFLDLYLLGAQAQSDLCLVSKHWPYRLLFFFAPVMRLAGYVDVEALTPEEVEAHCLQRLRQGSTLVLFPEGQRTRDGSLGRFHAGAFVLACKAGVPVVPLVLHNSGAVFPVGAARFVPATIRMNMLEAVHPAPFAHENLPHRAMLRHVRACISQELNTL